MSKRLFLSINRIYHQAIKQFLSAVKKIPHQPFLLLDIVLVLIKGGLRWAALKLTLHSADAVDARLAVDLLMCVREREGFGAGHPSSAIWGARRAVYHHPHELWCGESTQQSGPQAHETRCTAWDLPRLHLPPGRQQLVVSAGRTKASPLLLLSSAWWSYVISLFFLWFDILLECSHGLTLAV